MSTQPDHVPAPPAPAAQLRIDRRVESWVPAFEREWGDGS